MVTLRSGNPALRSRCHGRDRACTGRLMLPWRVLASFLVVGPHGAALSLFCWGSLSFTKVMRLFNAGVRDVFLRLRWPETNGKPVCPDVGCTICYACRRPSR